MTIPRVTRVECVELLVQALVENTELTQDQARLQAEHAIKQKRYDTIAYLLCPRCRARYLHPVPAMNSLSRKDNSTYICNMCGNEEALNDYYKNYRT